jgi:hypothetical protein
VINFLMAAFRSRLSLLLEIAALRHQLSLYRLAQRRPAIASSDRLLWSVLARLWRACGAAGAGLCSLFSHGRLSCGSENASAITGVG